MGAGLRRSFIGGGAGLRRSKIGGRRRTRAKSRFTKKNKTRRVQMKSVRKRRRR